MTVPKETLEAREASRRRIAIKEEFGGVVTEAELQKLYENAEAEVVTEANIDVLAALKQK